MAYQKIFKRYELKYLINIEQYKIISTVLRDYMRIDKFGKSLICNIYYDTDTFLLIRRSLDKPIYKEKIRLRSYGVPKENDNVFIELKKKFEGVVYKRRINMKFIEAQAFLKYHKTKSETQISKEINYCRRIIVQPFNSTFLFIIRLFKLVFNMILSPITSLILIKSHLKNYTTFFF